ncbi:MAG TPA: YggS family pyridoxal phosphate-dependent enzyme, partial [Bacteroidota bacterium]|nr:YggS family pyridoxal phosphate-dependent enzyme [Bacteroidota bacterium]
MIQERIDTLRRRIAGACLRAGREPSEVTLIAVSKTFGTEDIAEARREGIADFGENYIQELREKREVLGSSD